MDQHSFTQFSFGFYNVLYRMATSIVCGIENEIVPTKDLREFLSVMVINWVAHTNSTTTTVATITIAITSPATPHKDTSDMRALVVCVQFLCLYFSRQSSQKQKEKKTKKTCGHHGDHDDDDASLYFSSFLLFSIRFCSC